MAAKQNEHLTVKQSILDFQKERNPMSFPEFVFTIVLWNGPWLPIANVPLDKGIADSRNKINPCACMDMHRVWVFIDHYKD